jgi:hypothetical protein
MYSMDRKQSFSVLKLFLPVNPLGSRELIYQHEGRSPSSECEKELSLNANNKIS